MEIQIGRYRQGDRDMELDRNGKGETNKEIRTEIYRQGDRDRDIQTGIGLNSKGITTN